MDVKKRLLLIASLLLVSMVMTLVMMEKYGFSTFYEVRCDDERGVKCAPSGGFIELERDTQTRRIVIERFDFEGKRIDFVQGDDCQIPDNQNFACLKKSRVSVEAAIINSTNRRVTIDPMPWSMSAGKLLKLDEPTARVYFVDGFEFWRRRVLLGWKP